MVTRLRIWELPDDLVVLVLKRACMKRGVSYFSITEARSQTRSHSVGVTYLVSSGC